MASKKIARLDIMVPQGIGFTLIPAGTAIPAEHKDKLEEWERRGLVGEDIALETGAVIRTLDEQTVTQEEVDRGRDEALIRAAELAGQFEQGEKAREEALEEQVKQMVQDAGGDEDVLQEALTRVKLERGSSALLGSLPNGLTPEEQEAAEKGQELAQAQAEAGEKGPNGEDLHADGGTDNLAQTPAGLSDAEKKAGEKKEEAAKKAAASPKPKPTPQKK